MSANYCSELQIYYWSNNMYHYLVNVDNWSKEKGSENTTNIILKYYNNIMLQLVTPFTDPNFWTSEPKTLFVVL